jgi:isopenicillin-N epimerase
VKPLPRWAAFLHAGADDLVFVDNATAGANAVLRSFPLAPGDEILISDLAYGGVANAARFAARERGAAVRVATIAFPFLSTGILHAFTDAVTPRTKLALVDHISAESALVFPLAATARALHDRDIAVLADGAHAPGAASVQPNRTCLGADVMSGHYRAADGDAMAVPRLTLRGLRC